MSNYKVTADIGLNIRKEASGSATKVGAYAYGALVSVLEVKGGWGRTDKGWVSMAYLEAVTPPLSETVSEQQLRANIISIAKAYLGATVGSAAHKDLIDTYNTIKPLPRGYKMTYADPWCAATVSAFAIKAGLTDIIPPECSCSSMIQLFQAMGRWEENDAYMPKIGDILFYDWDDTGLGDNKGAADHVGIVSAVTGSTITVVEGNYNKAVRERTMQINGRYIRGYGLPNYAAKADKPTAPTEDYREAVKARFGLADETVAYLAAYQYGTDLLRKLATQG